MSQNFVVKAYRPDPKGHRIIDFHSCHALRAYWGDNGEVRVITETDERHDAEDFYIPSRGSEIAPGMCSEIIIENTTGGTVHRWVYQSEERGVPAPPREPEAPPLRSSI